MLLRNFLFVTGTIALSAASLCNAQSVISAKAGTLQYSQGAITIDGKALDIRPAIFPDLKEKSVLATGLGRAEILLTPGVFLRIGENSSLRMIDKHLWSTRVELLSGTAIVEVQDPSVMKDNSIVTIVAKDREIQPYKVGLVEISIDPAQVKVYSGEAAVIDGENRITVKDGRMVSLTGTMSAERFDAKAGDDLYLWARDRSAVLAAANMSSARTLSASNGYANMPVSSIYSGGSWYFNSLLGTYTFMPYGNSIYTSPFGYDIYSARMFAYYYQPGYYWYGGGGPRTTNSSQGVTLTNLGTVKSLASQVATINTGGHEPFGVRIRPEAPLSTGFNPISAANQPNFGSAAPSTGSVTNISPGPSISVPAAAPSAGASAAPAAPPAGVRSR